MGRICRLGLSCIGLLHTSPASRDDSTHGILLACITIDDTSISSAIVGKLHHPQVVVPLVVDIHIAGKLEGSTVLKSSQMMD